MPDVYEKIEFRHLTEDLKILADVTGMEVLRKIMRHLHGMQLYIPKLTRLDGFIAEYLENNKGTSFKIKARELNVSEQHLKNFGKRKSSRNF